MKNVIKRLLPTKICAELSARHAERCNRRVAFSQEGEDLVLLRYFDGKREGVYVDVGAHHPFRFSNTCLLHKQGWRGINIDAMPGSMAMFNRFRPNDINLELGVSTRPGSLDFFVFEEPALNTFDIALCEERQNAGWALHSTRTVQCRPLAEILQQEMPRLGTDKIDLLSVDVEGFDLDVLESNDWARFSPRVIAIEILNKSLRGVMESDIVQYCMRRGYLPFSKLHHTVLLVQD